MKTTKPKSRKPSEKNETASLRKRAEALVRKRFGVMKTDVLSSKEVQHLVHELRTHQIELEMQNEELRNAQLSLEEAKERYADLYDFAPVGYLTFDRNGYILEANLTGASMLGVERASLLKTPFMRFVSKEQQDTFFIHRRNVFETGERQACEIELKKKNGPVFYASLESVLTEGGLCRTVISDITGRKRAEMEILKLSKVMKARNEEIEEANKNLEAFIYSMSHDLRAPLRHIGAFAKILGDEHLEKLDEKGRDYFKRIINGSERMTLLIEDLLNFVKIATQEVKRRKIALSTLAESVVSDLRETYPDRKVEVIIVEGLTAFADLRLTEIILANLLGNAWKFTSKTGNARIEFGAVEQGGQIIYYVRDNGAGFDPDFADRVFQPFHRLHSDKEFPGSGIGLTIVERIVRRHGGRIWAEGKVGKGATIYFTLE